MSNYDILAIYEMIKPINIILFLAGIFTVLIIQALPFGKEPSILLDRKTVFIARLSHWGGFFLILFILYSSIGPGGWAYEDLIFFTQKVIMIRPEVVSSITILPPNMTAGIEPVCYYGNCSADKIVCERNSCGYLFANLSINGSVLFPNGTSWENKGNSVMVNNQSLPRKPELG